MMRSRVRRLVEGSSRKLREVADTLDDLPVFEHGGSRS